MIRRGVITMLALGAAFVPATAGAQVALGPALDRPPATSEGCEAGILPWLRSMFAPPTNCTLFATNLQVPRGNWTVTAVTIRTGARTGAMRVQIVQDVRPAAQASGAETPSGATCCTSPGQSRVFRLPPNSISTVPVDIPVRNTVTRVNNRPIEVVDHIGLSLLDRDSSLPATGATPTSAILLYPALSQVGWVQPGPTIPGAMPLVSAVLCPAAGAASRETRRSMQTGTCPALPGAGPALGGSPPRGGVARLRAGVRRLPVTGARRAVRVPLTCAAGARPCTGAVTGRTVHPLPPGAGTARRIALPARRFGLAPGTAGRVTVGLPPALRREFARGRTVVVEITVRQPGRAAQSRRVTLHSRGA